MSFPTKIYRRQRLSQVTFDKVQVNSEAVVGIDQTLILSGLSQREAQHEPYWRSWPHVCPDY